MSAGGETQLAIRRMRADETAAACAVWMRSKERAYAFLTRAQRHTPEEDAAFFAGPLRQRCEIWIALRGERVVGVMALAGALVDQLFVDPADQGRGAGSALLAHAQRLHPLGLALFTHQRNTRARGFYQARGFRAVRFGVSPAPESEPDVRYEWP